MPEGKAVSKTKEMPEAKAVPNPAGSLDGRSELIGALVALARSVYGNEPTYATYEAMYGGLQISADVGSFLDEEVLWQQVARAREEKDILVPECKNCKHPCGRNDAYSLKQILSEPEERRNWKLVLLWSLYGIAAEAARIEKMQGEKWQKMEERDEFVCKALFALGMDWGEEELVPMIKEAGLYLYGSIKS